jgi:sodium/hydrogen antiporter
MSAFQTTPYILVLTGIGLLIALVAWLPLALKKLPLSLPIVCIALGAGLFSLPQIALRPLPLSYPEITALGGQIRAIIFCSRHEASAMPYLD